MKLIELVKRKDSGYFCNKREDYENYGMEILADWFKYDVGSRNSQGWIKWLNDDSEEAEDTESNATWLEKYEGKIVFGSITDLIQAKGIYKPKEKEIIRVPREQVIEMLNTWEQLIKTKPHKIMITEEDGVFKMFEVQ